MSRSQTLDAPLAWARTRTSARPLARAEVLVSVQALRAAATLAVAGWHLVWVARAFPGETLSLPAPLALGYAGVDLFFVISGFIICHITAGRPFAARRFAARRFVRIVPLYALFTGLAVLAVFVNPAWDGKGELSFGYVLHSLLALPMNGIPYLDVGWSLEHELVFYAIAGGAFALGARRALPWLLLALFAGGVALHVVAPAATGARPVWDWHLLSPYHFQFAVGVCVFRQRERLARLGSRAPLLLGIALALATSWWLASHFAGQGGHPPTQPVGWSGLVRVVGYGLAGGLLLVAALEAERRGALSLRGRLGRCVLALGDASYVLYLSHYFVYSILAKLYPLLGVPGWLAWPALLAALFAACAVAWAIHVALERPLLRFARAHT